MGKNRAEQDRRKDRAAIAKTERARLHKILFTPLKTAADLNALMRDPEVMATGAEIEFYRAKHFGTYKGPSVRSADVEAAMANPDGRGDKSRKGRRK